MNDIKSRLIEILTYTKYLTKDNKYKKEAEELVKYLEEVDVEQYFMCVYCTEEKPFPPAEEYIRFEFEDVNIAGPVCSECVEALNKFAEDGARTS